MSTHILNDVEKICDKVGMLQGGKLVIEDKLDILLKRFVQPIYDIEFDKEVARKDIDKLQGLKFVEKIDNSENKISIWIENEEEVKQMLLKEISNVSNTVISLNLRKSSLEEIFIKVVK